MNPHPPLFQNQITNWLLRCTQAAGIRRVAPFSAAIASDLGNVRGENQDRAVIARGRDREGREYILVTAADGIGGMQDGGACAALAVATFIISMDLQAADAGQSSTYSEQWLHVAAHAANQAVFSKFHANGGSTLVALLARPEEPPCWLSIGDSRVYYNGDKALHQVSTDDTIAGQLGKTYDESSDRSQLLQFIGMGADLEPHIGRISDQSANAAILTTDGVHFLAASAGWFGQIVRYSPDPGACVKRLIDVAKWCGGSDNATAAFITLPVPLHRAPPLSYRHLELWDSFGDLQIISTSSAADALRQSTSDHPADSPGIPQSANASELTEALGGRNCPEAKPQPPKQRRGKTSRKPKKTNDEQSPIAEKAEEEPPQLYIEFPAEPN